ncbi:MAG TPA: hypothetical protein VN817_01340 [Solirubrobacteraceae bacterium]|nr:hypothetical protein [Solirubrobacteraceae bacterium]
MATQADAICARRNKELAAVPISDGALAATASTATRRGAIERRALTELGKLTPPASAAGNWKKLISASEDSLEQVRELAKAASSNDREGVTRRLTAVGGPQLRLLGAAVHTGTRECSTVG